MQFVVFVLVLDSLLKAQPKPTIYSHTETFLGYFYRYGCLGNNSEVKTWQQLYQCNFGFHECKSTSNAVPWSGSKWQVCAVFDVSSVLITEPLRVKFLWIREVIWVMVESINRHPDQISRLQGEVWFSWWSVRFHAPSVYPYSRRVHT